MKENSTHKLTRKKKLVIILTPVCALVVAAAIVTTVLLTTGELNPDSGGTDIVIPAGPGDAENPDEPDVPDEPEEPDDPDTPDDLGDSDDQGDGKDVSGVITTFVDPVGDMNIIHTFGFYYNATLDCYYEHQGIDISAEAGAAVYATTDGTVQAVYLDDVLSGNQVYLSDGNGLVTVYSFIDPVDGLQAGDTVSAGDVIGTVSAATGSEYKDGAHVHLEVYLDGAAVDPENYLVSTEK